MTWRRSRDDAEADDSPAKESLASAQTRLNAAQSRFNEAQRKYNAAQLEFNKTVLLRLAALEATRRHA